MARCRGTSRCQADSATPVAALAANITQPADSHFVAYDGDEPPWD
ncbi:hypothetical protein [Methylomonas koyamae]|nr:hypothetical protein [Methylomonas koyamae]